MSLKLSLDSPGRFDDQGFLLVRSLLEREELEQIARAYDRVLAGSGSASSAMSWIARPEDRDEALRQSDCRRAVGEAAAALLAPGEKIIDLSYRIFHKPPSSGAETPWHQDRAYGAPSGGRTISCWIALDDVDADNGCLFYSPGSARLGLLPHRPLFNHLGVAILAADAPATAMPAVVRAGDCVFHHDLTLHYSGPNRTLRPRRALVVKCAIAGRSGG